MIVVIQNNGGEKSFENIRTLMEMRGSIYMLLLSPSASSCTREEISSIIALMDDFHDLTEKAGQHLRKAYLNSSIE